MVVMVGPGGDGWWFGGGARGVGRSWRNATRLTCTTHASRPRRLPLPPPYTCTRTRTRTRLGSVSIESDRPDPSRSLSQGTLPTSTLNSPQIPPFHHPIFPPTSIHPTSRTSLPPPSRPMETSLGLLTAAHRWPPRPPHRRSRVPLRWIPGWVVISLSSESLSGVPIRREMEE